MSPLNGIVGWDGTFVEGERPRGVHPLASVGGHPESRQWMVGDTMYAPQIASSALVHAFCTIDAGTERPTRVGERSFLQARVHMGHDSIVGDDCEICAEVVICGFVEVGDGVRIGGNAWVKPRVKIGAGAIVGGGAVVTKDVPAHQVWSGNPARYMKLNGHAQGKEAQRMTAVTAIDWNKWRADYDTMSFAEHQAFNAEATRLHPDQRCWNGEACWGFLPNLPPHARIVELGGWDGSLAAKMLHDDGLGYIASWRNFDITPDVPQVCDDPRYERVVLEAWPWQMHGIRADALIASHVFEHMRISEIEKLITAWDIGSIYIDCPIGPATPNWNNYEGSHILEVGSDELLWRIEQLGYKTSHRDNAGGLIAYMDRA